jgi:hypothetical protein
MSSTFEVKERERAKAKKKMSESKVEGKVLIVERYPYGIRFYINGSEESYFIKDSDKEGWFVFVVEKNGEMVDVTEDKYENLGAKNLSDLYHRLVGHPVKYYEMLTGEKVNFDYLININDYKFDVCTVDASLEEDFLELSECYSVHKDEKRIDYDNYATFPPDWVLTLDVDYDYNELLQKALKDPEQGIKEIEKYVEW